MPSTLYLMVRSAEGASRTTHGGDAKSCFLAWGQFFTRSKEAVLFEGRAPSIYEH
jgi:phage/plasmid primase-like uncharacterized protein